MTENIVKNILEMGQPDSTEGKVACNLIETWQPSLIPGTYWIKLSSDLYMPAVAHSCINTHKTIIIN